MTRILAVLVFGAVSCIAILPLSAQRVDPTPFDSARSAIPSKDKSPAAAALLGFAPGVGHLYAGEINRGWLIIALYTTGYILNHDGRTDTRGKVGGVLLIGGAIAGVVDGAYAARRYNARMAKLRAAARDSGSVDASGRARSSVDPAGPARRFR